MGSTNNTKMGEVVCPRTNSSHKNRWAAAALDGSGKGKTLLEVKRTPSKGNTKKNGSLETQRNPGWIFSFEKKTTSMVVDTRE